MVSSALKTSLPQPNPYVTLAPQMPEMAIGRRIELMADLMEKPRGKHWELVRDHVLDPYGIDHSSITRPMEMGTSLEHVFSGKLRRFANEIRDVAKRKLSADLFQLTAHPTTYNFEMHEIDIERWQGSFYHDIVDQTVLQQLADAREAYIVRITEAREAVLAQAQNLAPQYRGLNNRQPDIVGLFYFYQVIKIHELLVASHDTVASVLPCVKPLFVAHELPVDPYLTSPAWYDTQGLSLARDGAVAMIRPLLESELVRHYQRAVRYNWRLTADRRALLEFAHHQHVVRQETLESVLDAQPPAWIGRMLAAFRRMRQALLASFKHASPRTPPIQGSMDDFLATRSNEMDALFKQSPSQTIGFGPPSKRLAPSLRQPTNRRP